LGLENQPDQETCFQFWLFPKMMRYWDWKLSLGNVPQSIDVYHDMTFRTFRTIIGLVMEGDSAAGLNSWKLRLVVADLRFVLVRDDLKYHGGDIIPTMRSSATLPSMRTRRRTLGFVELTASFEASTSTWCLQKAPYRRETSGSVSSRCSTVWHRPQKHCAPTTSSDSPNQRV